MGFFRADRNIIKSIYFSSVLCKNQGYMPAHTEPTDMERVDIFKELIYKLCDFLIERRRSFSGSGLRTPLHIRLSEFRRLFEYSNDAENEERRIEEIKERIDILRSDTVRNNKGEFPLIIVQNPEVLNSFYDNFRNDLEILISCSSEDLEKYQRYQSRGNDR